MNIQKIINSQFYVPNNVKVRNSQVPYYTCYGFSPMQQITQDTVSFRARFKPPVSRSVLAAYARKEARALRDARLIKEAKTTPTKKILSGDERTWGVSKSTAKKIYDKIQKPQQQIHDFMDDVFGYLKANELSPKNPILYYKDRAKSILSIVEKSATRMWNSMKEIFGNMTDLNGAKIVMNYKTGKADAENVVSQLIPLIRTRQVKLREIELQRPKAIENLTKAEQEEYDYVSKEFLDKLEDAQEEVINSLETDVSKIILIDRPLPKYTKGNYCALHLILELNKKGARPFELQLMGAREAEGKILDDKRLKFFGGKELDKKYAPLIKLWKRLMPEENQAAKERFLAYFKDAIHQLRKDEITEYRTQKILKRPEGIFMSVQNRGLPPEYDLNDQYKILKECEINTK